MNASASASTGVPTTYFEALRDSTREANGRPVIKVPGYPGFVGLPHNLIYIIVKSDPAKRQTLTAKPGGFLRADIVGGVTIKYRAFFGEEAKRKEKREEHEDTGYRYVLFEEPPSDDTKTAFEKHTGTLLEPSNAQHTYSLTGPRVPEAKPMESGAQQCVQSLIGPTGLVEGKSKKEQKAPRATGNWRVSVFEDQATIVGALADAEAQPSSKRGREDADAQPAPDAETLTPPP